jgi:hypothetical protein
MSPLEPKLKHLEFVQSAINRMSQNSFTIKGWAITLISALIALGVQQANPALVRVAALPILLFWFLDAFYLSRERHFRLLYEKIVAEQTDTDLSMNVRALRKPWRDIPLALLSRSVWPFYLLMAVAVVIAAHCIKSSP